MGSASRRLDRPELAAAVYRDARRDLREQIAVRAVLAATLRADGLYVDVGANRGQLLREALRVAPGARHVAFEPIPQLARELALALPTVEVRQLALAASAGTAEFCHFTTMDGWSGLRRSPAISDRVGSPRYIAVRVSTLDAELAGALPSVVKIDVEGAELQTLEGGREVLERARPLVVLEHVAGAAGLYGSASADVWRLLDGLGYEVFSIAGEGPFGREAFTAAAEHEIVNWLARPTGAPAAG
ncbi:MAG TPA: FkbM family methyltransferase [Solirubrobacteraceae bacterium]|nr:FkbM family methyltransferase [Solirubrobacteraceae bacterium]